MERAPVPASGREALWIAFLALAYFLAHEVALLLPDAHKVVAAVWPAGGIALAALLLSPRRHWPAILPILLLAGCASDLLSGRPFFASLGFMAANVVESLACACLLSSYCGAAVRFSRVREVLALIVCATAVNACTTFIGAGMATVTEGPPFWHAWQTWLIAHGLGILLVTPLIVAWSDFADWFRGVRWQRRLESGLFVAAWCAAGWLAFRPVAAFHPLSLQPFMLIGLLAWPALRLGQREVTLALAVLAVLAVTSNASAGPLLWAAPDPLERLLAAQVRLVLISATGLLLTAAYAEAQSAERIAREERARLQTLGDNLPNGVIYQLVRERDGSERFLYASAGLEPLAGISIEAVLRDPAALRDLIVEEDRPALAAAREASRRDMRVFDVEVRIRRSDGDVRWMQMSATPRVLPGGRILWDGILMDITARKREEAARRESEERFRLLVENAEMPVVIASFEDARVLFLNECAARYFEIESAEEEINALDHWRDIDARARYLKILYETGKVTGFEIEIVTRTGQGRWATVSASLIDFGGRRAVFTVLSDITAVKEAAARLEHERGILNAIFQTAPDMIWMKDADGRYVACNSATERLFALPVSAIIGRMDHELFPPAATEVIRAEDRAAIAAGCPRVDHAWVTIRGEGRQVLLETTKTPMLDGEGRLVGILCIARDTTAAHLAQEALRERVALQERLEKLAAVAPGALFSCLHKVDGAWSLPYASPAFEDICGVPPEAFAADLTPFWAQLLHPADRHSLARAMLEVEKRLSLLRHEFRVRNPSNGETWVELCAVPVLQPDGSTLWHGFVMDISERKLAEAALAEEVVRRRILFEQSKDGIVVLDLNGKLQEANQAFAHMLGYTPEEMLHLHVWDWDAQWTREELLRNVARRFTAPATFETRHRRKDGSFCEVEVSSSGAELGGLKFIYCVIRDITRRKAAEIALGESRRLEGIGILAGGMAHEFNNLLTVINGYSGVLADSFDLHDPMREQVDAIRAAGERAAGLTRQLLAYGRKQIIRPRVLDLNLVVGRSRHAWAPLLRAGIGLTMDLDPSAGLVLVDADQMRDVLVNLVKNAVEALPNGGVLAISTANASISEEYAAQHADARAGSYVMLSVADTGVGMDETTQAHVFEPFFTTRNRATSTGLGLATVHGSVAQHHGWITVESALGRGSIFKIYLPRVADRAGPDYPLAPPGEPDCQRTILVVEDEDAVRRLTVSILKACGYRTLEAANVRQARMVAERHKEPIHLILMDVILPGITGLEMAEQLKSHIPAAKVLYVSGYPENVIADSGIVAANVAFIQKPYSADVLVAKVREILDAEEFAL